MFTGWAVRSCVLVESASNSWCNLLCRTRFFLPNCLGEKQATSIGGTGKMSRGLCCVLAAKKRSSMALKSAEDSYDSIEVKVCKLNLISGMSIHHSDNLISSFCFKRQECVLWASISKISHRVIEAILWEISDVSNISITKKSLLQSI